METQPMPQPPEADPRFNDFILLQAQNELLKVPGVERALVHLVWSPPWTPEMMSLEAKMMLGFA